MSKYLVPTNSMESTTFTEVLHDINRNFTEKMKFSFIDIRKYFKNSLAQ